MKELNFMGVPGNPEAFRPRIYDATPVRRLFDDGNAAVILAKCCAAARREGWDTARRDAFLAEAKAGDYENLVSVVVKYFEEEEES